jgi:hypothetical protein
LRKFIFNRGCESSHSLLSSDSSVYFVASVPANPITSAPYNRCAGTGQLHGAKILIRGTGGRGYLLVLAVSPMQPTAALCIILGKDRPKRIGRRVGGSSRKPGQLGRNQKLAHVLLATMTWPRAAGAGETRRAAGGKPLLTQVDHRASRSRDFSVSTRRADGVAGLVLAGASAPPARLTLFRRSSCRPGAGGGRLPTTTITATTTTTFESHANHSTRLHNESVLFFAFSAAHYLSIFRSFSLARAPSLRDSFSSVEKGEGKTRPDFSGFRCCCKTGAKLPFVRHVVQSCGAGQTSAVSII